MSVEQVSGSAWAECPNGVESALEALIQGFAHLDLPAIQHMVRANAGVDKALTNAFGVSAPASKDSVQAGLQSYIEHLRKSLGGLINSGPPFT